MIKAYPLLISLLLVKFCAFGQCAGQDTSIIICDYSNMDNQNFNLLNALNGNPISGGTWIDNNNLNIFTNSAQNEINIWEIGQSGTYSFTYSLDTTNCPNSSSTLTLIIGGYAGEDNYSANACENDINVDLFQFIGSNPNPFLNGYWIDVSNTGALENNIFDATIQGPGTYTFTYNVESQNSCPTDIVTVELTVHPLPVPSSGAIEYEICGLDEIANQSNLDLNTYLPPNPSNGYWSDNSGTNEINGNGDTIIDIQNIFNNFGYGEYSFSYTAIPNHPICEFQVLSVIIKLRRKLDFSNATLEVESICENDISGFPIVATINGLPNLNDLPSNSFIITYNVNGPVNLTDESTVISLTNPESFVLPSTFTPTPGIYSIEITAVEILSDPNDLICELLYDLETSFEVYPIFEDDININIVDFCLGEDLLIQLDIDNSNFNEDLVIDYDISGANNFSANDVTLNFSNGSSALQIPANLLPNTGNNQFEITKITTLNGCITNPTDLNFEFEIFKNPDPFITLNVENICWGDDAIAVIGNLTGIDQLRIEYSITGANSISNQIETISVNNTNAQLVISESLLTNTGATTIIIHEITNAETGCSTTINNDFTFEVNPLPNPPDPPLLQEFCEVDAATVSDLTPNQSTIFWYTSENSQNSLSNDTPLSNGTYWVSQLDTKGCYSNKTSVSVVINQVPIATLLPAGNEFCGVDEPSIIDLSANTAQFNQYQINWYDQNGNLLSENTLLSETEVYVGYTYDSVTNCETVDGLEVRVSLTACEDEYDFFIPDAFSPNNDGINDVFRIPDIQYLYPDYTYEIYNRYGKLLYEGDINRPYWNGEAESDLVLSDGIVPNGVYFYIVNFNKDNISSKQGRLYVNR
ncbi:gliding motility-associated C-terminal domain-containing protein [Mesonia oceanica]|uniref:Uncharacterized protein n=1 Tax=Mesonia oceanica TaxID=2687242 RepID=A0AC61YBK5_9FLAO|nr:gliding motility-associated C-terminal domain-containing protein [Mesonia oceanica]VVV01645.1 hypothetical protein FVB9532_02938 [Mesonia oceanica]